MSRYGDAQIKITKPDVTFKCAHCRDGKCWLCASNRCGCEHPPKRNSRVSE